VILSAMDRKIVSRGSLLRSGDTSLFCVFQI
jgi:hypothetical protein